MSNPYQAAEVITLIGCAVLFAGLLLNMISHSRSFHHEPAGCVVEAVWWLVNGGQLLLAIGILWIMIDLLRGTV